MSSPDSDEAQRPSCARGRVRFICGVAGHYELRVTQTAGFYSDVRIPGELGEATVCLTRNELLGLRRAIDAMLPSTPESAELKADGPRDEAAPVPSIVVGE